MAPRAIPLREGIAPVRDRLLTMLFLAGLLHAIVILGITFSAAESQTDQAPSLAVLLVSDEIPESERNDAAAYLAQRTQLGAGNTRQAVAPRNRSSQPPQTASTGTPDGESPAAEHASGTAASEQVLTTSTWNSRVAYLAADLADTGEARQKPLLTEQSDGEKPGPQDEDGSAQLRGPLRGELWITPDTRAASLAPYLDAWRRKVERVGTLNYPAVARQRFAGASPVLEVAIAADGRLERAVIRRASGVPDLDQAALDILKLASPFDPFPAPLARQYRVLRFAYEWQFVGGRVQAGTVTDLP